MSFIYHDSVSKLILYRECIVEPELEGMRVSVLPRHLSKYLIPKDYSDLRVTNHMGMWIRNILPNQIAVPFFIHITKFQAISLHLFRSLFKFRLGLLAMPTINYQICTHCAPNMIIQSCSGLLDTREGKLASLISTTSPLMARTRINRSQIFMINNIKMIN